MGSIQRPESLDFEKMHIESLEKFVNETVSILAASTNLDSDEALDILESVQVEMLGELRSKVEALRGVINNESVRRIDSAKLSWEMEKAIKAISFATDLNTYEITTILSRGCK